MTRLSRLWQRAFGEAGGLVRPHTFNGGANTVNAQAC